MIEVLKDIPIISTIFDKDATAIDLLVLVLCIAIFWAVFFYIFGFIVGPLVKGKAWLHAAASRDYDRGGKEIQETLGCPMTREEFTKSFEEKWPWMQGLILQHLLGGMFCVPAIFNLFGDTELQSSLACLGVLSEMGWEIEDMITWMYRRWFTKDGKTKVPMGMIIILGIHHSLTTILGLPMVVYYRNNPTLHWLTFDLQFAGAVGLFVSEYTKILDVADSKQLLQFQCLTGFALLVMVITRGFHWIFLCTQLIMTWYNDQAYTFLIVGTICALAFTLFNWIFCIDPFYKRFVKFMKMSNEYTSIPATADAKTRRSSLINLQQAAANVMIQQDDLNAELVAGFLQRNVRNKSNRRDTVPPNMFTNSAALDVNGNRRRLSSNVLLRSSMGNISVALNQLHAVQGNSKDD